MTASAPGSRSLVALLPVWEKQPEHSSRGKQRKGSRWGKTPRLQVLQPQKTLFVEHAESVEETLP